MGGRLGIAMVVCWVGAHLALEASEPARRPNVLILLTDDQRADTIAALGNPVIKTPNLDRLARSGFVFNNAYCLGSNSPAVCLPSRNMLLSGRYYFRWEGRQFASADQPNLPDSMKQAGYETWHEGKLGNTAREIQQRFDHSYYLEDDQARTSGEHGQRCVDDAIAFLNSRAADKPFCMYLAFEGPHDPRVAAPHYLEQYDRAKIPLPTNFLPIHPFDNGEMTVRDERLEKWPRTPDAIRQHLHEYYACITSIDGHIGRLLQTLRDLGQFENTLIIFSSDNGLAIGSHGLMGKQNLYEEGMKVPLLFCGPGIPAGRSDALVYLLDIFPTVCELVGTDVPTVVDGKSLVPVITGLTAHARDTLFLAYRDVQRAVRDERWKLIVYPKTNKRQLFDLHNDPYEMHDLSADRAQSARIDCLWQEVLRWQQEMGDAAPLQSDQPANPTFVPPQGS
jgi:arylsulfatase A-like enzyme